MDRDGSAVPARKTGKFKPKSSARRSQNQREQEELAENAKKRQRQIEVDRAAERRSNRGGLSRARGNGQFRGGLSGWRSESQATGFLGGTISGAPAESSMVVDDHSDTEPVSRAPVRERREANGRSASIKKKKIITADVPASLQIKDEEDGTLAASGNNDFEANYGINIDDLAYDNLISDEDVEHKSDQIPRKVLYPIRLKRKADIDKKATPGANDESKTAKQIQQEAIALASDASKQRKIINNDDDDDDDELKVTRTVDVAKRRNKTRQSRASQIKEEEDSKPNISSKSSIHTGTTRARDYINVSDDDDTETTQAQPVVLNSSQTLFSKPILQTAEDHEEWRRHQTDMRAIAEELGPDEDHNPERSSTAAAKQGQSKGRRDEKVYLLQLPPIMPNLQAHSSMVLDEQNVSLPADFTLSHEAQDPTTIQAGTQEAPVKVEDDAGAMEADSTSKLNLPFNASSKSKFKGPIGTLTIYKSGDTVLDWGGLEFQLERGMGGMLQETLLVDDESSVAYSMSQVAATFVVKPKWNALFETRK